jgi:HAD superfamily hydrolase (TIGR01549 family)
MAISWIFLDAGNTLIGLEYAHLTAALEAAGLSVTEAALRAAEKPARRALDRALVERWGGGDLPRPGWVEGRLWRRYWSDTLLGAGAPPGRLEALTEAALSVTRPAASWTRMEPHLDRTLGALRDRGMSLGVISNSSGTLEGHLHELGLARHFEMILDSHHLGIEKPHPGIFEEALRRAGGVAARDALYVGDVYGIDVLGAAGVGLRAVLLDPRGEWDPSLAPADAPACRTVASLTAIDGLLDGPV